MPSYSRAVRDYLADGRWRTVTEIAGAVGCHPGTAWRLMNTLRIHRRRSQELPYHPFVYRDPRAGPEDVVVPGR